MVSPDSNGNISFPLSPSFSPLSLSLTLSLAGDNNMRSHLKEQPNTKRWHIGVKTKESWSPHLKSRPSSRHCRPRHHPLPLPPPLGSCCPLSIQTHRSCSELERGSVLPLLDTPLNHRSVRRSTAAGWCRPATSWCPPPLCPRGSTEPFREDFGVRQSPVTTPSPPSPPTPDTILLNADNEPACLSARLSVALAVNLHQVP